MTTTILAGFTGDYTGQVHYAQRADGVWFVRYQNRTPWGYRWSAWRRGGEPSGYVSQTNRKARLPKDGLCAVCASFGQVCCKLHNVALAEVA